MFDGIQEEFSKDGGDVLLFFIGQVNHFIEKLNQPVGGFHVASSAHTNPFWRGRYNLDAIVPARPIHGTLHDVFEIRNRERRREITERAFAHRLENIARSGVAREYDHSSMGMNTPDLAKQADIFLA